MKKEKKTQYVENAGPDFMDQITQVKKSISIFS